MKIAIELDQATVAAIKKYLQQLKGIPKPTKDDVTQCIQEIVEARLTDDETPLSDYVNFFRESN